MFINAKIVADSLAPAACLELTLTQVLVAVRREAHRQCPTPWGQDRRKEIAAKQPMLHLLGFVDAKGNRTQLGREALAQPGRKYGEALLWAYGFNIPVVKIGQIDRSVIEAAFGVADGLTDDVVALGAGKVAA